MNTNLTLERDSRYSTAKLKLSELQLELKRLEVERSGSLDQINQKSLNNKPQKSRLDLQAESLLDNGINSDVTASTKSAHKTYAELTEKIIIVMHAINLQRQRLTGLTDEISKTIAQEVLPQHNANVKAIVKAALELEKALADEHDLRDRLQMEGISCSSVIRPMPFRGAGLLRDNQSNISRYLLECLEFGFITEKELPESLRSHIPSKADPVKKMIKQTVKAGNWMTLN